MGQRTYETLIGLALSVGLLAGCAEASSTATIEAPQEFADPEFVAAAERALSGAGDPDPGWQYGVVHAEREKPWAISLITADGGYVLNNARDGCPPGDWLAMDDVLLLLEPGDLITWSTEGDDNRVCSDEIRLVRKAAAL